MSAKYYKKIFRIASTRLPDWDYTNSGYYFVTICTRNHKPVLGKVIENQVQLNKLGKQVQKYWLEIPKHFQNVSLDEFVIMPNHLHGIVAISPYCRDEALPRLYHRKQNSISPKPGSLSTIIGSFKSIATKTIHLQFDPAFHWQSRFWEHIIRSETKLEKIRDYIRYNPSKWSLDEYYQSS